MLRIICAQASNCLDILGRKGSEEYPDIGDLISHLVLAENVTLDDFGLLCLANVGDSSGKNCISIVRAAILSQEPDQALFLHQFHSWSRN